MLLSKHLLKTRFCIRKRLFCYFYEFIIAAPCAIFLHRFCSTAPVFLTCIKMQNFCKPLLLVIGPRKILRNSPLCIFFGSELPHNSSCPSVCWSVGGLVGQSVVISQKAGKLHKILSEHESSNLAVILKHEVTSVDHFVRPLQPIFFSQMNASNE